MSDAGGGFGRVGEAPIASEAVRRIDILFEIERTINGKTPEQRLAVRREKSAPIVADLEIWMRQQRTLLSSGHDTAKAINHLLNRWAAFTRLLDDGRVCLSNNAAERALRGVEAVRRLDALFEIERAINGRGADERSAVRQEKSKPLLDDMHAWLLRERETLSRSSEVLKPINYMLRRWGTSPLPRRWQDLLDQ